MSTKTIVFIGGTAGIGRAAVRHLVKTNCKLILLYRSHEKLKQTLSGEEKNVISIPCDLLSLESIHAAVKAIRDQTDRIDVLVNNAGMWEFGSRKESQNGIESTFQVNVLAPYIFTNSLHDLLEKSDEARVINTASALHTGDINFDDIEMKKNFSGFKAYRQSKLCVVLLTRLWAKNNNKIKYFSLHPGVVSTELGRSAGWLANTFFKWFGISPEKGAETLIYLVESDYQTLKSGEYYTKKKIAKTLTKNSYDLTRAEKLVEAIEKYPLTQGKNLI